MKLFSSLLLLLLFNLHSLADEINLSYLEIKETKPLYYSVVLKVPSKKDQTTSLSLNIPKYCSSNTLKSTQNIKNAIVEQWQIKCDEGLENSTMSVDGLKSKDAELLLRIELLSGASHSVMLSPESNTYLVPKSNSAWEIIQTYTWLGITHILLGFDHILFVFALLLIVKNMRRLLWTVTAFTLAHSLTMIVATLGIVTVPQAPVEAIIALSILFLAMEIMHEKQGKIGLTSHYPWLIAFIFGLLHGFGFAGALAEIGLPQQAIALALLFFNIGVELGQLMFVVTVVSAVLILQRLASPILLDRLQTAIVYLMGGVSSFWLIERTLSF